MSFALTTEQLLDGTKTVTRRLGWRGLKPGDPIQAIEKGMGLKPGEKQRLLRVIRITDVRREKLERMVATDYGNREAVLEGFPEMTGTAFVKHFCKSMRCLPTQEVTRIEFEYVEETR